MNFWLAVYRIAMAALVAVVIIAVISLFLPKLRQNQERQRKITVLEEENRARESQTKQLQRQQDLFLSDPKYVERVAREELGKARSGEIIYRFNDNKTNVLRSGARH